MERKQFVVVTGCQSQRVSQHLVTGYVLKTSRKAMLSKTAELRKFAWS